RARKRVLLCDGGTRRNAAAEQIHGFVTRDGTAPDDFRRIGRAQLEPYPAVELVDVCVQAINGSRGAVQVRLETGDVVDARRILLCTGMIDELPDIDGFSRFWGTSVFICPYCHSWELQGRRFGFLTWKPDTIDFALLLRNWTSQVTLLTDGRLRIPADDVARLCPGRLP